MTGFQPHLALSAICLVALVASPAWCHPGTGIVVDTKGQVFFVHGIRSRILKMDSAGRVTTFAQGTEGRVLSNPHHLVMDKEGHIYSVGDRDGQVCKVTPDGRIQTVYPLPDSPGVAFIGSGGDPFTIDASGTIYCCYYRQWKFCQILAIGTDGRLMNVAGGDWGYADGQGVHAQFRSLHSAGFAWTGDGGLLVTDDGSSVRRITPDGTVTTVAGGRDAGFADGAAKKARFHDAMGLAIDAQRNIYVADSGNHRIRRVTPDGHVSTIAGSGQREARDGAALQAGFENPTGVAIGPGGTLYVLDFHGDDPRVRKLAADGRVLTVAAVQ